MRRSLPEKNSKSGQCASSRLDSCGEDGEEDEAKLSMVLDLLGVASISGEAVVELGFHGGSWRRERS